MRILPIVALAVSLTLGVVLTTYLIGLQPNYLFPAPMVFVFAWSLAPLLAVLGVRSRSRARAAGLTAIAFAIDAMSIISLGGGLIYALFVAPLLLITLVLLSRGALDPARGAMG